MKKRIATVDFVTILVMACCLGLGGFASSALAAQIVVTTLTDTADPPFDADDACGTGTVADLPGADGLVSLREAIIAANNTGGADTITFDQSGTIVVTFDDLDADADPDPLPALCGGDTHITGNPAGDDVPAITLDGTAFPASSGAAGILVLSSYNTIEGLRLHYFPLGIFIRAGDLANAGAITDTKVVHNIVAESKFHGIAVVTGNGPDSLVAHTTLAQNQLMNNAWFGILIQANLDGTGSDTQILDTTITDNEVTGNGLIGILMDSMGDRNVLSDTTIAHNTISGNAFHGINVIGGYNGADKNRLKFRVQDNTITDNGLVGIRVVAGQDNSSNNHVVARIEENILERNTTFGIAASAGQGAVDFPTGDSNHNELTVWIVRNTITDNIQSSIVISGGVGNPWGLAGGVADGNQTTAIVQHNTTEDNVERGMELLAGGPGLASVNTVEVRVAYNTVCNNSTDIVAEGGFTGSSSFPAPNQGTGNVLEGQISYNTATTVAVADGVPGNTATVTQSHNDPCP